MCLFFLLFIFLSSHSSSFLFSLVFCHTILSFPWVQSMYAIDKKSITVIFISYAVDNVFDESIVFHVFRPHWLSHASRKHIDDMFHVTVFSAGTIVNESSHCDDWLCFTGQFTFENFSAIECTFPPRRYELFRRFSYPILRILIFTIHSRAITC